MTQNSEDDSIPEIKSATVIKRTPKDQSKKMILTSLGNHYLFSSLSIEDMDILFTRLKLYIVPSGEIIFEQGALGKKFYIIETGKLEVYRNNVKKTILKEGEAFGEMAVLTDATRRATIKTIEKSTLWGIGREEFRAAIKIINSNFFKINQEFISNLQIFSYLPDEQIIQLTEATVQHCYPDNYRIICEGDEGSLFFIIIEGYAVAKIKGVEMFKIGTGEMFGEAVLLGENHIRNISVYSMGPIKVLSVSRDSIISIIGENYKEIIYKTQAKNSLKADRLMSLLPLEVITYMLESIEWKFIKPGELAITESQLEENLYILCLGSISSSTKTLSRFEVIGYSKKIAGSHKDFLADNEVILGEIKKNDLATFIKVPWKQLKSQLKIMRVLRKSQTFAGISPSKLRYIASHVSFQEFDKKEIIYRYNDEAHDFYVIKKGSVEIFHNGKMVRMMSKFDVFGDNCIDEPIRTNSAKALADCTCIVIKSNVFKDIIDDSFIKILERKKTLLAVFSLNQLLMIKQISQTDHDYLFLAYVKHMNKFYKIEAIAKDYCDSIEKFNQIIHSKNIAMQGDHQFMQKLIKTFSDSKFVYLVYEHIDSVPFYSILGKKINEEISKFLTGCLISVLEFFHDKDIIYRGLDPDNIVINDTGYPIIANFHTAKLIKGRTYTVVGNPLYTAPEVNFGNGYLKSADMWSLGVLIYQFLYNSYPFEITGNDSPIDIFNKSNRGKLNFPLDSKYIRGNEVIVDLLKVNPKERLTSTNIKYSRWLDSVHWQSLDDPSTNSPLQIAVQQLKKPLKEINKLIPLPRYLNVIYIKEIIVSPIIKTKSLKFNWDKHF